MDKERALEIANRIKMEGCMYYALVYEIGFSNIEDEKLLKLSIELATAYKSIMARLEEISGESWENI